MGHPAGELGVEHGGIVDAPYGSGLSFRDPDGIALEFFAPPGDCCARVRKMPRLAAVVVHTRTFGPASKRGQRTVAKNLRRSSTKQLRLLERREMPAARMSVQCVML